VVMIKAKVRVEVYFIVISRSISRNFISSYGVCTP